MLVKELIEELQKMNPNYDVHMLVSDGIIDHESEIECIIEDDCRKDEVLLVSPTNEEDFS